MELFTEGALSDDLVDETIVAERAGAEGGEGEAVAAELAASPWALPDDDEDIVADLKALGVITDAGTKTPAELEQERLVAVAGFYLDRMGRCDLEAIALNDQRDALLAPYRAKIDQIEAFYAGQLARVARRRAEYERQATQLAELAQYPGKKKSLDTPFGTLGFRDQSASVELVDESKATAWAVEKRPELVRVTAKLPLTEAREYLSESELAACKQELRWGDLKKTIDVTRDAIADLPPGVARIEPRRAYFAKPEVRG
jgi:hypothetical protein